jgi:hypothetical protein
MGPQAYAVNCGRMKNIFRGSLDRLDSSSNVSTVDAYLCILFAVGIYEVKRLEIIWKGG